MNRKNKDLRVVRDSEDVDKLVRRIMDNTEDEETQMAQLEEQVKAHKKKIRIRILIVVILIMAASVGIYLFIHLQTYTNVRVANTYPEAGSTDSNYKEFSEGVIRYSRDGMAYLSQQGEEKWNQAYQIKAPTVAAGDDCAIIFDKGGNDVVIFQKDGVKGEIHTTLPIEKATVSSQGIVCAVLKDSSSPKIVCYDTAGNILVEHKTSLTGTGYPMDVAISPDAEVMQVTYLYTQDGGVTSRVVYYNFGSAGEQETDHQVTQEEYKGTLMAEGFFMSQKISAVVGDNMLTIYQGESVPKETSQIKIDKEIKSVFHDNKYIGLILKNEGKGGYELRLYNTSGKQTLSKDFTGDYGNVKLSGGQVIMYDGNNCSIFLKSGIQKFEGEIETNIREIFPTMGVNKYIVINANGMENVRLVK